MRILHTLYFTASILVVVAAGLALHDAIVPGNRLLPVLSFSVNYQYPVLKGAAGPQSPVRIVGGSIRPSAVTSWKPGPSANQPTWLVSANPVDTTTLSTDADLPQGSSEEPVAWLGVGLPWVVTLVNRNSSNVVRICPASSQTSPACVKSAATNTYVWVQIVSSGPYFVADSPDTNDNAYFRYYDPNATTPALQDKLERIGSLQFEKVDIDTSTANGSGKFLVYKYTCTNGRCSVNIGQ
jgi:hypothetical protein